MKFKNLPTFAEIDAESDFRDEPWEVMEEKFLNSHGNRITSGYAKRREFTATRGWSIPCAAQIEKIKELASGKTILEIGSGMGLLAGLLRNAGVSVIATDAGKISEDSEGFAVIKSEYNSARCYTEIDGELDHEAAMKKYEGRYDIVQINWPCYGESWATEVIKTTSAKILIYIGEWEGGCNADDEFFLELGRNWEELETFAIPRWYGIHDRMRFFKKKD